MALSSAWGKLEHQTYLNCKNNLPWTLYNCQYSTMCIELKWPSAWFNSFWCEDLSRTQWQTVIQVWLFSVTYVRAFKYSVCDSCTLNEENIMAQPFTILPGRVFLHYILWQVSHYQVSLTSMMVVLTMKSNLSESISESISNCIPPSVRVG